MRVPVERLSAGKHPARGGLRLQSSSMVEHAAVNRDVEGSSPSSGAIFNASGFSEVSPIRKFCSAGCLHCQATDQNVGGNG